MTDLTLSPNTVRESQPAEDVKGVTAKFGNLLTHQRVSTAVGEPATDNLFSFRNGKVRLDEELQCFLKAKQSNNSEENIEDDDIKQVFEEIEQVSPHSGHSGDLQEVSLLDETLEERIKLDILQKYLNAKQGGGIVQPSTLVKCTEVLGTERTPRDQTPEEMKEIIKSTQYEKDSRRKHIHRVTESRCTGADSNTITSSVTQ